MRGKREARQPRPGRKVGSIATLGWEADLEGLLVEVGHGNPGGEDRVVGVLSGEVSGRLGREGVEVRGLDAGVDTLDALLGDEDCAGGGE